jgi:hypothetical protein
MGRRDIAMTVATMLATAAVAGAQPYDAKANFYSASVLRGAIENIAQMREPELRAFTHYLAECQDEHDGPGKHACSAAEKTYTIEFGAKRALDDWIVARSIFTQLPPEKMDTAHIVDEAKAYARVVVALERAVSARFSELKVLKK